MLPDVVSVERPRQPGHGDYASTLALQVARKAGVPATELAQAIASKLGTDPAIQSVEIAGPGFLNIRMSSAAAGAVAGVIVGQGDAYGHGSALAGQRVNLEFVSANPTGPIHVGGVRWAAVGDALARLMRAEGAEVTTEYYFNDAGAQIDRFARSLLAAARHENPPEDGYAGEYISEIAETLVRQHPDMPGLPAAVATAAELRQPHRVTRYLEDLSGTYHRFHDACRVLPRDDGPLDETGRARLWLTEAAQIVLANGLGLLGVTAPDRL